MDGIHDLGGFQGFGSVDVEVDEPLFHSEQERRIFRLAMGAMLSGRLEGKLRHAVERIDPEAYLACSYYERWLTGVATVLVEAGILDRGDLDGRLGRPFALARPTRGPCCLTPGSHPNNLSLPLATTSWSVSGIRSATHGPLVTSGESKARLSDSTVPSLFQMWKCIVPNDV